MSDGCSLPGGNLEHAVLVMLWSLGKASVREVYARVGAPRGLAYTTIATVLVRLHAKGLVARKRIGRSYRYEPKAKRKTVERARAARILRDLLRPEPEPAIATLVDAIDDPELLGALARAIAARRRGLRGS